jgi:hypothetical protein
MNTLILEKLFRAEENMRKIRYILSHCDVTMATINKAAVVHFRNPYHNFGHALGATEQGIRLAIAEGRSRSEINLIALTLLFHDAGHPGKVGLKDEMDAFDLANSVLLPSDTIIVGSDHVKVMQAIRELLLSTIFPGNRGKTIDGLIKIIHDADLAHLGQGHMYWMFASMGIYDEFKLAEPDLTLEVFIRERQQKFVDYLLFLNKTDKAFVSKGAQMIFRNPVEDVKLVTSLPIGAIYYAYGVRKENIPFSEFRAKIECLSKVA